MLGTNDCKTEFHADAKTIAKGMEAVARKDVYKRQPAKQYILEALEAGKQVVTANKDLLAEHGEEVMGMADKMHADLQFCLLYTSRCV